MIYINLTGGLGNALFQIAAINTIASDNNDTLCLLNVKKFINDLNNDVRLTTKHAEKYRYLIDRFKQIDYVKPVWSDNQQFSIPHNNNPYPKIYSPFQYTSIDYHDGFEYVGYFQSEKYFKHLKPDILEWFRPADEFHDTIKNYSHLFNGIFIHIRRGDYVNQHQGRYIYLGMEYYNRGINELPKDVPILIFSDDLDWCREHFIGDRFIFIDEPDYISLYLMSNIRYGVIANSSFSWWGAWLGKAERIYAPKEWFGKGVQHKSFEYDIIPDNWIKI